MLRPPLSGLTVADRRHADNAQGLVEADAVGAPPLLNI